MKLDQPDNINRNITPVNLGVSLLIADHTVPQADLGLFFVTSVPTMPNILYDP